MKASSYYAVIFTSKRNNEDHEQYGKMAEHMVALAKLQPGYLGHESYRNMDGLGCTISYWKSEEDILNWKKQSEHSVAQQLGRQRWYEGYTVRIAKVEREYSM